MDNNPDKSKGLYPLTRELFDLFLEKKSYTLNAKELTDGEEKAVKDGVVLFNIVINKLLEKGVYFSSPGNSMQRHFILWFNSHFTEEKIYSHKIEIKQKYVDLICEMIKNLENTIEQRD